MPCNHKRSGTFSEGGGQVCNGYIAVKAHGHPSANKRCYIYEHRLVMEKILGRNLRPEEQVHHKNGVKTDNRPENLELLPDSATHIREHWKEYERLGIPAPINRPEAVKRRLRSARKWREQHPEEYRLHRRMGGLAKAKKMGRARKV